MNSQSLFRSLFFWGPLGGFLLTLSILSLGVTSGKFVLSTMLHNMVNVWQEFTRMIGGLLFDWIWIDGWEFSNVEKDAFTLTAVVLIPVFRSLLRQSNWINSARSKFAIGLRAFCLLSLAALIVMLIFFHGLGDNKPPDPLAIPGFWGMFLLAAVLIFTVSYAHHGRSWKNGEIMWQLTQNWVFCTLLILAFAVTGITTLVG